jgi:dTDP-4-amino-4,6-dideoxygalactose transaminase
MALLRSHGITRDEQLMQGELDGPWYYQQIVLGYNYRMTELQAALGCSQLQRLDEIVANRNRLAQRYNDLLAGLPLQLPFQSPESYSAYHLYIVRLQLSQLSMSHRQVYEALQQRSIGVNLHYIPIYRQPYYQQMGFAADTFINAEQYYQEAISIPLFAQMTLSQQDEVVAALTEVLQ